jgi:hypothetical protein
MGKILVWLLVLSLTFYDVSVVYATSTFVFEDDLALTFGEDDGEYTSCVAPDLEGDSELACPSLQLELGNNETNVLLDDISTIYNDDVGKPAQPLCSDEDIANTAEMSKSEVADLKNDLARACKEQYKYHKRQFAKQMFKKGRIFKSLGILLRKNKVHVSSKKDKHTIHAEGNHFTEVQNEVQEEEAKILAQFRKDFPAEMAEADQIYSDNGKLLKPKYHYSAQGKLMAPGNITIKKPGGSCTMKVNFDDSKPELPPVDLMPPLDFLDSYPDDCAFMVSDKFTEKDAMKLMGETTKSNICNKELNKCDQVKRNNQGENTFDQMDKLSDSFFEAGIKKSTPNFKIQVTRNLYKDQTPDLAYKRGLFVQKYVYKQLQDKFKDLNPNEIPDWAKTEEAFAKVFVIEQPLYDGLRTSGDYGPDPLAKPEDFENEKERLNSTLKRELDEVNKLDQKNNKEYVIIQTELKKQQEELKLMKTKLVKLQNELNRKDVNVSQVQADIDKFNQMNAEYFEQKYSIAKLEQDLDKSQKMQEYYKSRKAQIDVNGTVKKLDEFYHGRPADFTSNQETYWNYKKGQADNVKSECKNFSKGWDAQLFSKFKMAKVEGSFTPPEEDGDPELADVHPKIKYMIDKMIQTEGFSCDYSIRDIKRSRPKYKKGNRNWPRLFLNVPWVTIKAAFVPGWLVALGIDGAKAIGSKIKPETCPNNFGTKARSTTSKYFRGGNIKKKGKKGSWETVHKKPIKYDGNYDIWPEAQEAFNKK